MAWLLENLSHANKAGGACQGNTCSPHPNYQFTGFVVQPVIGFPGTIYVNAFITLLPAALLADRGEENIPPALALLTT